jgi:hypothetical protein
MQAMCAEIAVLLLGVSPVTPPIRRSGPTWPWCGRRPVGRRRGPSCPPGVPHSRPSIDRAWPPGGVMNQTEALTARTSRSRSVVVRTDRWSGRRKS